MAKAIFSWDDENIAHIGKHGHIQVEVERAVQDPRNEFVWSREHDRPGVVVRTRPGQRFMIFFDTLSDKPWTIRVVTMFQVLS